MPILTSVTVSLVPEARGGPFVFWDDLPAACAKAGALGFDAVEVFPPSAEHLDPAVLRRTLADHGLSLAAMGTGAGWVKHRLTLSHADPAVRARASAFVRSIIDLAGPLGAPAIIGSMQGRSGDGFGRIDALSALRDGLASLGEHARGYGVPLLFEPLNRYETDLANTLADGAEVAGVPGSGNVRLLADLFHMNIEEQDIAGAIRKAGAAVGHVHFVDSNRRAPGLGHLDFGPVAWALGSIGYAGYVSAEALPLPDPDAAAAATIASYRRLFPRAGGRPPGTSTDA